MKPGGLLLPVTSPFREDTGELDGEAFRSNLRNWSAGPVDGFVVAGSTGEAPLLDGIELLRLTEWARESVPEDRAVVAGTGTESTRRTVRLCREVARCGADAVLVRPPCYYRDAMTPEAIVDHFTAVADASPVPVILYHIPRYVPVELEVERVARLVRHDNVTGIKDSGGDLKRLGALARVCQGEAALLVGAGTLLYAGLEVGAAGGVLAVGDLAPGPCGELIAAWREGRSDRAGALQERVGALHRSVVAGEGVPGVKAALDLLGRRGGPVRAPLLPLDSRGRERVRRALVAAGLLPSTRSAVSD